MTGGKGILIAHAGADAYLGRLQGRFPGLPLRVCRSAGELEAALAAEGFAPTVAYSCRTETFTGGEHRRLLACPSLRWLQVGGSGYDHLAGWEHRAAAGLTLTNAAGVLAPALAEAAVGAMLALAFGLPAYLRQQARRQWRKDTWRPLKDRTLLVVGAGAIGREVGTRAAALGMRVVGLARRPSAPPPPGFSEVRPLTSLLASLREADVVSLHLRLTPETAGLFGEAAFAAARPGALFLNSARGGLVDEAALARALADRRLAGAWLDVFATEPLAPDSPLWNLDNVILTPHCADQVTDWEERLAEFFMDNLDRYLGGGPLLNRIEPEIDLGRQ
jgi:phosphoglycerate dehydrogenase-like enzyme